jgi:hypothetical protein
MSQSIIKKSQKYVLIQCILSDIIEDVMNFIYSMLIQVLNHSLIEYIQTDVLRYKTLQCVSINSISFVKGIICRRCDKRVDEQSFSINHSYRDNTGLTKPSTHILSCCFHRCADCFNDVYLASY